MIFVRSILKRDGSYQNVFHAMPCPIHATPTCRIYLFRTHELMLLLDKSEHVHITAFFERHGNLQLAQAKYRNLTVGSLQGLALFLSR